MDTVILCCRERGAGHPINFPVLLDAVAQEKGVAPADKKVWFADEARIGQKNKITRRWARRGTRPVAPKDQRTTSTYIFGAICPRLGKAAGLALPRCNIAAMNLHLAKMATAVAPGAHAVLLLDQTGWHLSQRLAVPPNITLMPLPAKCPQLIERRGAIRNWMIDDTGVPKKGTHSVGVARQYCGQLGKQDNCQIAVTLSVANDHASLPLAHRLYLPQAWADDPDRRARAGVPDAVAFQTKPQIALAQIRAALAAAVPAAPVLAGTGYGIGTDFRDGITDLGLLYIVGIQSSTSLWSPGTEPLPPKPWSGRGRPPSLVRRNDEHKPIAAKQLATGLPKRAWRRVTWREGSNTPLASRFAAVRVRPGHRDYWRSTARPEEWLLIERPAGEPEPIKYWLATLPETAPRRALVNLAKLRWRVEHDYQGLKQERGLGHYQSRGWRGFHHHATLCIAAYGFLIAERATIPP